MIKHVSFDLWMTLIRSNPDFRKKRAEFIVENYNPKNKTVDEIMQLFIDVDKYFDRYHEIHHTKIPAIKMYSTILEKMDIPSHAIQDAAGILRRESEDLFLKHPPFFLNDHIPTILKSLKDSGLMLSIGSNTGFTEGNILRLMFNKLNILHYFSFLVFSDEIEISKPAAGFFQRVWGNTIFRKSEILHVGDNPTADYQGAIDFGFNALLLTDSNYTLDDIRARL